MADIYNPPPHKPPPPPPPIQQWDPNSAPNQSGGGPQLPDGSPAIAPPHVPSGGGDGSDTSVDTISMKRFAENISQLLTPLNHSLDLLQNMKPVAAGGFFQAANMRKQVTGDSGDGMMQSGFETVVKKIIKSINDTHDAVTKLATDYTNTEDQNNIELGKLTKTMSDVNTDISAVGSAGTKFGDGSSSGPSSGS